MSAQRNLIQIHPHLSNFRSSPVIDAANAYDTCGHHIGDVQVGVVANISTDPYLPECRVIVQVAGLGNVLLRPDQSARLRAHLETAEREAAGAMALADDKEITAVIVAQEIT